MAQQTLAFLQRALFEVVRGVEARRDGKAGTVADHPADSAPVMAGVLRAPFSLRRARACVDEQSIDVCGEASNEALMS